jgi:hypothetical protein
VVRDMDFCFYIKSSLTGWFGMQSEGAAGMEDCIQFAGCLLIAPFEYMLE